MMGSVWDGVWRGWIQLMKGQGYLPEWGLSSSAKIISGHIIRKPCSTVEYNKLALTITKHAGSAASRLSEFKLVGK